MSKKPRITFKRFNGEYIVTVNGEPYVFDNLTKALKYIAARY
jgi:asparagine synthetase B (glutamine-hydrolysing)